MLFRGFIIFVWLLFGSKPIKTVVATKSEAEKTNENNRLKDVQENLALPVPPRFRSSRGPSRMKVLDDDESKAMPKFVRLPAATSGEVGSQRKIEIIPGVKRTIKLLSSSPKIFEVEDFLDDDECDLLIELAKRKKMKGFVDKGVDNFIQGGPENTFYNWDLNDDGLVDAEEMALVPGKSINFTVEDADDMIFMLKMDNDGDGMVNLEELKNTDLSKLKEYLDKLKETDDRKREMKSENAWVWHDEDELLRFQDDYFYAFHTRFTSLTDLPEEIFQESEPLQVQHFEEKQFSQCRRDSDEVTDLPCCLYGEVEDCRNCRFMTVAIFLSDVEEGGELVFPLADHRFSEIMKCSGEWRGYFTYAKTTGSKNRFSASIEFANSGANKIFSGDGRDASGQFDITDGIILGNTARFQKSYSSTTKNEANIQYSGKIIGGSRISGNWWVPGRKRLFGTFFMWNRKYEILLKTSSARSNHQDFCTKTGLSIKPQKGKAVFWYNHLTDFQTGMVGERDNDSLFGHCVVQKGDKWVATARVNIIGDGEVDLRAWRRGMNWMQNLEKYPNILKKIGSNKSRTKLEQYKEDFEKFKFEDCGNKNTTVNQENEHKRKAPSHVLNAVNSLLNAIDRKGLDTIASVVHKKLRLTCVPFFAEEKRK